jgi:hypothetical protein
MTRSIRDELSQRLKGMTHEEQREFVKEQLAEKRTGHDERPAKVPAKTP